MRTGPDPRHASLLVAAFAIVSGIAAFASVQAAANGDAAAPAGPAPTARTLEQFQRSCVLCHVTGEGGAPRMGDAAAWSPRLAQGEAVLLQHAIEGYRNMPPLGYCQDCERGDFRALIELMSRGAPVDGNATTRTEGTAR